MSCLWNRQWFLLSPALPISVTEEGKFSAYGEALWTIVSTIQLPFALCPSYLPVLSGMETDPNIHIIIKHTRKACLLDPGCRCQGLLINNYKAPRNSKCPPNKSHKNVSCHWRFRWLLPSPHYLLLPRHPAVQMALTEKTSVKSPLRSSLVPKYPAIICAFLQKALSVAHQKSSLNANKNQYFRFYCEELSLVTLL